MSSNEKLMWWAIGGWVVFWLIALPALFLGPKPFGAGPQPTSTPGTSGGTGA